MKQSERYLRRPETRENKDIVGWKREKDELQRKKRVFYTCDLSWLLVVLLPGRIVGMKEERNFDCVVN